MKPFFTFVAIIFLSSISNAQTPEEIQAWQKYMTPSDTHQWLAKYDGEWSIDAKLWMAPNQPPISTTAIGTSKMILGGRFQQSETKGDFMGMPYEGTGIIGYDNAAKKFVATWIDSMGTGMIITEGTYDEKSKKLTRTGKTTDPLTGKDIGMKEITTYISDDKYILEAFMTVNGSEFKSMESTYTRKK